MLACERDRVWLCCPALVGESVKSAQLCWRKTGKRGCCEGIFLSDWRKKKGKAISEWIFLLKLMTKKKCNWWLFQIKSFHVALRREGGAPSPSSPLCTSFTATLDGEIKLVLKAAFHEKLSAPRTAAAACVCPRSWKADAPDSVWLLGVARHFQTASVRALSRSPLAASQLQSSKQFNREFVEKDVNDGLV